MASRRKNISFEHKDGTLVASIYTRPDANGAQGVAETLTIGADAIHTSLIPVFMFEGFKSFLTNRTNRLDDPDASDLRRVYDSFAAAVADGTWQPGRQFEAGEPSDLELAIAEATGQPVHLVQKRIDEVLSQVAKNPDGTDRTDKRGHVVHVYSKSKLYAGFADDPKVKPILARLTAERARRMAAEAKAQRPDETRGMLDLFGAQTSEPTAAEAAQ